MLSKSRSILLVDDELDIVNSIKRWLQADGFKVYGFANPLQALEYFQTQCTVLSSSGGILAKILPPFKMGLGGRIGNGNQYMSWIGLDDLLVLVLYAIVDLRSFLFLDLL